MHPILLSQIYKSLSSAFPAIDFSIISPQNQLVYVHSPGHLFREIPFSELMASADSLLNKNNVFRIGENTFYSFWLSLPKAYSLCVLCPAEAPNSHDIQVMFRSLLNQLIPSANDDSPPGSNFLFFYHLLHKNDSTSLSHLSLLSANTAYDLSMPRLIAILDVSTLSESAMRPSALEILDLIRHHPGTRPQDITGLLSESQIVICKVWPPEQYPVKSHCKRIFSPLLDMIRIRFLVSPRMVIGFLADSLEDYSFCLKSAWSVLQAETDPADFSSVSLLYCIDYLPRLLMDNVPPRQLHHYFSNYAALLQKHPGWADSLEALVQHNMDINAAASSLYLHKNSLIFRLRHMTQAMHLDSLQSDQTKYFLVLLYTYLKRLPRES